MKELLDNILSNSTYSIIAGVLLLVLVIFLMKKLFKYGLFVIALIICFFAYVHFTGGDIEEIIEEGTEELIKLKDDIKDGITDEIIERNFDEG